MLLQKDLQPFGDEVRVGRSDGDAAGVGDTEAVEKTVALARSGCMRTSPFSVKRCAAKISGSRKWATGFGISCTTERSSAGSTSEIDGLPGYDRAHIGVKDVVGLVLIRCPSVPKDCPQSQPIAPCPSDSASLMSRESD